MRRQNIDFSHLWLTQVIKQKTTRRRRRRRLWRRRWRWGGRGKYNNNWSTQIRLFLCKIIFFALSKILQMTITSITYSKISCAKYGFRQEPWSSGYGIWHIFKRSWVQIPAPYTGWNFLTLIFCKKCLFEKTENKKTKNRPGLAHFIKNCSAGALWLAT